MDKIGKDQIKSYYSEKNVVESYDKRRFLGVGGGYINDNEIAPHIFLLNDKFKNPKAVSVLDIGAGRGRLSTKIKKEGFNTFSLDSSPEMVKYLKKYIPLKNIIIQSAFDPLKIKTKFDVLTSLRFFDHFNYKDQKVLLKNFSHNLSKKGVIIFATLNKNSLEHYLSSFFYYGKVNFYYEDKDYTKLFRSVGFEVLKREQKFFVPRGIILRSSQYGFIAKLFIFFDILLSKLFPSGCAYFVYLLKRK